jgi:hypothetical protein
MTRAELRQRVLRLLYDDPEQPVFWQVSEINALIDEAQAFLAEDVEALTRSYLLPQRQGALLYNLRGLSQQVMRPYRVWSDTQTARLRQISMRELDASLPRWLDTRGTPEYWFSLSWETFGVWPVPAQDGGTLRVESLIWPEPLPDDTSELPWSLATQDALIPYVLCAGALKEQDVARALDYETHALSFARVRGGKEGVNRLQTGPWGRVS